MPTFTAQMPIKELNTNNVSTRKRSYGYSFMEMMVVLAIVGMIAATAMFSFIGKASSSSFTNEALEIINVLKTAQNAASQTGRKYAVVFDLDEQTYELRVVHQIEELDDEFEIDEENVLSKVQLPERCWIDHVVFDDFTDTRVIGGNLVHFLAGRYGWQNGGKIGLLDLEGNPYSIIVNRLSKSIILEEGEIDTFFLEPKTDLPF